MPPVDGYVFHHMPNHPLRGVVTRPFSVFFANVVDFTTNFATIKSRFIIACGVSSRLALFTDCT